VKEGLAPCPGAPGRPSPPPDNEDGNKEASPIPSCKGGAGAVPWGAREASPIPSYKGGTGAAPWGARKASPIPSCEGGASGIIYLY